jgi:hypothetical protein
MPMDLSQAIWLHVIAAIPPTLAAVAALVTSLRAAKKTREILVLVNGQRAILVSDLADARAELARKESV